MKRSVKARDGETVTTLEVIGKKDHLQVRESDAGPIEVRVRDTKKNADGSINEKVYSAPDRDQLKRRSPDLVRRIESYEKMVGDVAASVDGGGATATSGKKPIELPAGFGKEVPDAKRLMRAQLDQLLKQNAGNPELENLIRKMIDDLDR